MSLPSRARNAARSRRRVTSIVAVTGLGLGLAVALPAAIADASTARVSYPGSVPGFVQHIAAKNAAAKNAAAKDAGAAKGAGQIEGEVYLDLKDLAGANAFATAVSTPGNAQYGRYLSPKAWIAKYAPTQTAYQTVADYLTSSGASIIGRPASREYIVFTVPATAADAAFGTSVHQYSVQGKTVSAPSRPASLPANVAKNVLGISLGNSRAAFTHPDSVRQGAGTGDSAGKSSPDALGGGNPSCSRYYGQITKRTPTAYGRHSFPTNICGYLPDQLRSAGGLNKQITSGMDGTGQTIAIVDAYDSPSIVSDTNDYFSQVQSPLLTRYHDISFPKSEFRNRSACQFPSGWQGEQTLDVQSAHSIAPGADILYSGGFDCIGGLDLAVSKILDKGLATIVSNSYGNQGEGIPLDSVRGANNYFIQAAGEGIGLYFSSGDSGDESVNLGYTQPDFPASSPWVTAVGGTSEAINADGSYGFETGWEDILDQFVQTDGGGYQFTAPLPGNLYGGGAGGGVSSLFAEPDYQKGVVPDKLATSQDGTTSRVVPDIGDLADPYTGFLIALSPIVDERTLETGDLTFETFGGTSLASPIAAAKMAMVQAATGLRIGFANPAIYLAAQHDKAAFHDVVAPDPTQALYYHSAFSGHLFLVTLDQGLSLFTGKGYDTETGVGSLVEPELAHYLGNAVG